MKRQSKTFLAAFMFVLISAMASYADPTNMLSNGGFENQGIVSGLPYGFGYWAASDQCAVVGTSDGICPFEGTRMLHFIASDGGSYNACNVWQLVDMTPLQTEINSGRAVASLSIYFNRVLGDCETDTAFGILAAAFTGSPSNWLARFNAGNYLAYGATDIFTDGDPLTWENLMLTLPIPPGTNFIAVHISADENIFNDAVPPEFDGHYADAASMTIRVIPAPGAFILGSIGVGFVTWLRRRRTL